MKKFFVVLTLLLCPCAFLLGSTKPATDTFFTDITAQQGVEIIKENIDNKNFVILDIRSPSEFDRGHIENAININYYDSDFSDRLNKLDKNKTWLMYCQSGGRSRKALKKMEELGFKKVYHLKKGYGSWGK